MVKQHLAFFFGVPGIPVCGRDLEEEVGGRVASGLPVWSPFFSLPDVPSDLYVSMYQHCERNMSYAARGFLVRFPSTREEDVTVAIEEASQEQRKIMRPR